MSAEYKLTCSLMKCSTQLGLINRSADRKQQRDLSLCFSKSFPKLSTFFFCLPCVPPEMNCRTCVFAITSDLGINKAFGWEGQFTSLVQIEISHHALDAMKAGSSMQMGSSLIRHQQVKLFDFSIKIFQHLQNELTDNVIIQY